MYPQSSIKVVSLMGFGNLTSSGIDFVHPGKPAYVGGPCTGALDGGSVPHLDQQTPEGFQLR